MRKIIDKNKVKKALQRKANAGTEGNGKIGKILDIAPPTAATVLKCRHCDVVFSSMLVLPEKAVEEVSLGFIEHLRKQHKKQFDTIAPSVQKLAHISMWLITVGMHTRMLDDVADDEQGDFAVQQFEKQMQEVMNLMGVEEIEDFDDEEDDDEDDEEDDKEGKEGSDAEENNDDDLDDAEDVDQIVPVDPVQDKVIEEAIEEAIEEIEKKEEIVK